MTPNKPTFYIFDGLGLIFRSYYALSKARMSTKDNFPTGAIYGFMSQMFRLIELYKPDYVVVAFDSKEKTFRHGLFSEYKSHRPSMPDDFIMQIEKIRELLSLYNIPQVILSSYEADDIIGTLSTKFQKECSVFIVSTDKDFSQLVNENIKIIKPGKQNDFEVIDIPTITKTYGIHPSQFIDYLTLTGDASDNIPGVKSIGPKTASQLLSKYGSLENIKTNLNTEASKIQKAFLESNTDLSKQLVTICTTIPSFEITLNECRIGRPQLELLIPVLKQLELKAFLQKLQPDSEVKNGLFNDTESQLQEGFSQYAETSQITEPQSQLGADILLVNSIPLLNELCVHLMNQPAFAFDTETTSLNMWHSDIVALSFAFDPKKAWVVHVPSFPNKQEVFRMLKPCFEQTQSVKIGQNIKFDMGMLLMNDIQIQGTLFDTMLASYVLDPDARKHNMDDLALQHLNFQTIKYDDLVGKGKKQLSIHDIPLDKLVEYSGQDAVVTYRLFEILSKKIKSIETLNRVCEKIEFPLIYVLLSMEQAGVSIDSVALRELSTQFTNEAKELKQHIFDLAGEEFNIDSPKQLAEILFNKLQLPALQKTKTGLSTSVQALEDLESNYPIVKSILEYRHLQKLINTYIDSLPKLVEIKTGLVHTSYNQTIAATGRLSSTNPNLQNIPIRTKQGKSIRKAFVSRRPNEWILVSADYSQIELRIAAELSNDATMINAFQKGEDIHEATAKNIFGTETISRDMRDQAKAINFGVLYGMSSHSLSKKLNLSFAQAKKMIDEYKTKYKALFLFMDEVITKARKLGYIETLFGRRRYIPNLENKNTSIKHAAERAAINSPVQGTAADLIKIAMLEIYEKMKHKKLESKMVLQVHDELIFDAPCCEEKVLSDLVKHEMTQAALTIGLVGITKAESMVVSVLLALLLIGVILMNTMEITSKEVLVKSKEDESFEGANVDSLTAAQVIKQWQESEHVTTKNPFLRNETATTHNNETATLYDRKNALPRNPTPSQQRTYEDPKAKRTQRQKLDINQATTEEIIAIKGLGEWTAQQIQNLKKRNGGKIDSIPQLKHIRGMRENVYETITKYFEIK
ncbi:hypothetical protein CHS0354_023734 [Potamilus streckersoni]|uniref:DNA-directed DNA polymerase n=1 Tax=Potamilus streckersoni TaxID=2493646 RepID=A0AAE0RZ15_9BIVA|nr:hypothetical protein CHS0354_023734 [Potamilus streckersoni]